MINNQLSNRLNQTTQQQQSVSYLNNKSIKSTQIKYLSQTLNSIPDFIKKFHIHSNQNNPSSSQNKVISIYENQFKIRLNKLILHKQNQSNSQNANMEIEEIKQNHQNIERKYNQQQQSQTKDIYFETVPYDAAILKTNVFNQDIASTTNIIISNRSMPVRIYQVNFQNLNQQLNTNLSYSTFHDHKLNSQEYLAPYQFSVKCKKVFGVGRKFFNIYDCQKIKVTRINAFDKIHLSTVSHIDNQFVALTGDFEGNIYTVDLRQTNQKIFKNSFKPHVDAVFHLKGFETNEYLFLSSARKDNFTYLFDRRNLKTFVKHFEFQRDSNQRYGLATKQDTFAIGSENGSIYIDNLLSAQSNDKSSGILFQDAQNINISDISIENINEKGLSLVYSSGTRFYKECEDQQNQTPIQNNINFGLKKLIYKFN